MTANIDERIAALKARVEAMRQETLKAHSDEGRFTGFPITELEFCEVKIPGYKCMDEQLECGRLHIEFYDIDTAASLLTSLTMVRGPVVELGMRQSSSNKAEEFTMFRANELLGPVPKGKQWQLYLVDKEAQDDI